MIAQAMSNAPERNRSGKLIPLAAIVLTLAWAPGEAQATTTTHAPTAGPLLRAMRVGAVVPPRGLSGLTRTPGSGAANLSPGLVATPKPWALVALRADEDEHTARVQTVRDAYAKAMKLFNDLELDSALEVVDDALRTAADEDWADEPVLAALFTLRAALSYSTIGDDASEQILRALTAALERNAHISIPPELRSEGMENYLEDARDRHGGGIPSAIIHDPPSAECGDSLLFRAQSLVPDDGQVALYWRPSGERDFRAAEMRVFANVADAWLPFGEHLDGDLEYFIVTFDESEGVESTLGTMDSPLELSRSCDLGDGEGGAAAAADVPEAAGEKRRKRRAKAKGRPRFTFGLGLGTGIGIAYGTADNTPEQYFPASEKEFYSDGETACALARWASQGNNLVSEKELWGGQKGMVAENSVFGRYADSPDRAQALAEAYNADYCAENHGVQPGIAMAPFHIAPEFGVILKQRFAISLYSRLQLVNGENLRNPEYQSDPFQVASGKGEVIKSGFAWAIGAHARFLLGSSESKIRPHVGVFAGYGITKLRIDMGFAQDLDGNSVPDNFEAVTDSPGQDTCESLVFPYSGTCSDADYKRAEDMRSSAQAEDKNRVDTVTLGPAFGGVSFGLTAQFHPNVGVFAEVQLGAWFPKLTSGLLDIAVGPVVSF